MDANVNNANTLQQTLLSVARKQRRASLVALELQFVWIALASVILFVFLDTATPLPPPVRVVLATALLVGLAVVLYRQYTPKQSPEREALYYARRLESHYGRKDNPLVNAVYLASQADARDGTLPAALAQRCVDHATRAIDSIATDVVVDRLPVRRNAYRCGWVVVAFVVVLAVSPSVMSRGVARLIFPFADHPPYSSTRFAVEIDPNPVPFSTDVVVTATLSGHIPNAVFLAQIDEHGDVLARWPMQPTEPSRFTRRLIALRQPTTIRIETAAGYSRRYAIEPVKASEGSQAAMLAEPVIEPNVPSPGEPGFSHSSRIAREAVDDLTQAVRRIDDLANDLTNTFNGIDSRLLTAEQWFDRQAQLALRLDRFAQHNESVVKQLREAFTEDGVTGPHFLRTLPDRLEHLALRRVAEPAAVSTGQSRAAIRQWLQSVRTAAAGDLRMLADSALRLSNALASEMGRGSESREGSGGDARSTLTGGARTGRYEETLDVTSSSRLSIDALVEQAPQAYRDLVAQYFARLIQDQAVGPEGERKAISENTQQGKQ